jgi:tetratricopeptide (TPR) repeat protein
VVEKAVRKTEKAPGTPQGNQDRTRRHRLQYRLARYEEAGATYRRAIELDPEDTTYWNSFAWLLYLRTEQRAEAVQAARRAVELDQENKHALHTLITILFAARQGQEALPHCRRLFEIADEEFLSETWDDFVLLFKEGLAGGMGQQLLNLLDESEAGQHWRPLREALAAAVAKNADLLLEVAPEVRKPALEILARLAPELEQGAR